MDEVSTETGGLFGGLWPRLTGDQFAESVALFERRALANGFDLSWLNGKECLDAGCGSGRYSVAMALHGAGSVTAIDISDVGLDEARRRAEDFIQITFSKASVLDLPYPDSSFDLVWSAGVIHHTADMEMAIHELVRVLRPDGKLFLLVYGEGGLRWKAVKSLRPIFGALGQAFTSRAIDEASLPANAHKHFMDDLFVPIQTLTPWPRLRAMLQGAGLARLERWEGETFDHESSPASQFEDIVKLKMIAQSAQRIAVTNFERHLTELALSIASAYVAQVRSILTDPTMDEIERRLMIIGEGNHRVIAER